MTYPDNPPLECDIVMKGGITSGVIYPRAVCRLAKTYRLRSVGGSSAGAIAAAGAAAAGECEPATDAVASEWYRRRMVDLFVGRALERLAAGAATEGRRS